MAKKEKKVREIRKHLICLSKPILEIIERNFNYIKRDMVEKILLEIADREMEYEKEIKKLRREIEEDNKLIKQMENVENKEIKELRKELSDAIKSLNC